MRDEIFDQYLADILKKTPEQEKSGASADEILSEGEKILPEAEKSALSEDIGDFAEKTIRFSNGDVTRIASAIKKSEEISEVPQPVRKKRKKRVRKANYSAYGGIVLATFVVCCSIVISLFVIVVGRDFLGIDTNNNSFTLYIENDWTIGDIANYLSENGIIEYPELFRQFAKLSLGDSPVYPGDIDVKPSMSYPELCDLLSEERVSHETETVTFTEGMTLDAAAALLEESGVCGAEEFIFAFNTNVYGFEFENYVSSSSLKFYKYEGYLFPDTYEFYVGDSVYNIVRKIKERTNEIISPDLIRQCGERGYTLEQIMTMASIIQLESGRAEDMDDIAAVFYNRLNDPARFPRLQTDTTTRYIENVIKADSSIAYQEMYDAYDTYVCSGLPVGPICNPGLDAIICALNPAQNDYYYFCSDVETGEFYYAETYDEHLENIERAGLGV